MQQVFELAAAAYHRQAAFEFRILHPEKK